VLLADLPVMFWAFWMAAGFVLFAALVWTIARLAVREDAGEAHPAHPASREADPPGPPP